MATAKVRHKRQHRAEATLESNLKKDDMMMMSENGDGDDYVGRKKREGDRETEKKRAREKERAQTLAQTTLKITIGCLCRRPRLDFLIRVSRRVERDQKKKNVHVSWSITSGARNGRLWRARTHAKHL